MTKCKISAQYLFFTLSLFARCLILNFAFIDFLFSYIYYHCYLINRVIFNFLLLHFLLIRYYFVEMKALCNKSQCLIVSHVFCLNSCWFCKSASRLICTLNICLKYRIFVQFHYWVYLLRKLFYLDIKHLIFRVSLHVFTLILSHFSFILTLWTSTLL